MKRNTPPLITIGLSLILALFCAALTYSVPKDARASFTSGAFFMQVTSTSKIEDKSVIGSTDQIVIMSGVISVIIVIPILMKRNI